MIPRLLVIFRTFTAALQMAIWGENGWWYSLKYNRCIWIPKRSHSVSLKAFKNDGASAIKTQLTDTWLA